MPNWKFSSQVTLYLYFSLSLSPRVCVWCPTASGTVSKHVEKKVEWEKHLSFQTNKNKKTAEKNRKMPISPVSWHVACEFFRANLSNNDITDDFSLMILFLAFLYFILNRLPNTHTLGRREGIKYRKADAKRKTATATPGDSSFVPETFVLFFGPCVSPYEEYVCFWFFFLVLRF